MRVESLEEGLKLVVGINAADQGAGTVNGTGFDTSEFDQALILFDVGDATTGTANVKLQESDELATGYTDIAGAAFTEVDSDNDLTSYIGSIETKNFKPFIRVVSVVATAAIELSVSMLFGKSKGLKKVTQVNSTVFAVKYTSDGGTASL